MIVGCLSTTLSLAAAPGPAVAAPLAPAAGANLLANADFTEGSSDWRAATGTSMAVISALGLPVGTTYLQASPGPANQPNIAQAVPVTVTAGQSYHGSIWVKSDSGASLPGTLALWGVGATAANGATYFTAGPNWTQINVAFNPTANYRTLLLQVYLRGPGAYDFLDAQTTPQLLANSDFTEGSSDWRAATGTSMAVISALGLPVGTTYLQASPGPANQPNIAQAVPVTVTAGQSYHGSIWVKSDSGASLPGTLALWGVGATAANGATYFTAGPNWTQINVAFNPTANYRTLLLQVYLRGPGAYDFLDAQTTPQLLANSDFTEGSSDWRAATGTSMAVISALGLPVGTTYLQASPGPANQPNIAQAVPVTVTAGQSYHGSIWVKSDSGASLPGTLALWGVGATAANGATYFTAGPNWTQINVAFNPTANYRTLLLQVYLRGPGAYDFLDAQIGPAPPPVTGTGPYGFQDLQDAATAIGEGWPGIGSVSGFCTAPSSAYACPTGADANMAAALLAHDSKDFWLSFWTVGAPVNRASWYTDGFTAGQNAAREVVRSSRLPSFEILDPEGFGGAPTSTTAWASFVHGWAAGLTSVSAAMHPGLYADQYLVSTFGLVSLSVPVFLAVSPILGNKPAIVGAAIRGNIAFYAACPADAYVNRMNSWGAPFNTLQFNDSAVDCAP